MGNERMEKYILDKTELVNYLKYYHCQKYNKPITPIKLQKALYFLFAFWAKFVKMSKKSEAEYLFENLSPNLFHANFEAWAYGSVDRQVYDFFKTEVGKHFDTNAAIRFRKEMNETVELFFADYLDRILNTGDFSLVDLSHEDLCWKNHYDKNDFYHSSEIPSEEIIEEYGKKIS